MREKAPPVTERKMRCEEAVRWLSGHRREATPLAVARHTARCSFCRTFADEMSRRKTKRAVTGAASYEHKTAPSHWFETRASSAIIPTALLWFATTLRGCCARKHHSAGWTRMARTDDVSWRRVTACAYRNRRAPRDHSPGRRTSTGLDEQCDKRAGWVGGCRWKPDPAPEPERSAFANVASLTPGESILLVE
jgi:hypothetical protein